MGRIAEILDSEDWKTKSPLERAIARRDLFRVSLKDNPKFAQAFNAAPQEDKQRLKDSWQQKLQQDFPDAFQADGKSVERDGDAFIITDAKVPVRDVASERVAEMMRPYAQRKGPDAYDSWQRDMQTLAGMPEGVRLAAAHVALERYGDVEQFKTEDGKDVFPSRAEITKRDKTALETAADFAPMAARVGAPIVASIATRGNPRVVAGATALGEVTAQTMENLSGTRRGFSPNEVLLSTAFSMIPAATLGKASGTAKTLAGVGLRSLEGAAQGAGFEALRGLSDEGKVNVEQTGKAALMGAGLGGTFESIARIAPKLAARLAGKSRGEALQTIEDLKAKASGEELASLTEIQKQIEASLNIGAETKPASEAAAVLASENPPVIKPAKESALAMDQALSERELRAGDFEKAKAEAGTVAALEDLKANQLDGTEAAPSVADQPEQMPKLSPQAQRVFNEYGFINPTLARTLGGATAGGVTGAAITPEGDTERERVLNRARNTVIGVVLGAGGGYALGRRFTNTNPVASGSVLAEVDKHLAPVNGPSFMEKIKALPNDFRAAITTKFAPLDPLQAGVYANDPNAEKALGSLKMSRRFEQLAGIGGMATEDLRSFRQNVVKPLNGQYDDFDRLLFLKRTGQRLQWNVDLAAEKARIANLPPAARTPDEIALLARDQDKSVGKWDLAKVDQGLAELEKRLGSKRFAELDQLAAGPLQQELDHALRLQVESGRLSQEAYDRIKAQNDFYAPFRVLKTLEGVETGLIPAGIDTRKQVSKAIDGIHDEFFKIVSPLSVAHEYIWRARELAEKNRKMLELAKLAEFDATGEFVRKLRDTDSPQAGKEAVNYFENGQGFRLEVDPKVHAVIKGLSTTQSSLIGEFFKRVLTVPRAMLRTGATTANAGFQAANMLADQHRFATVSKYGLNLDDAKSLGLQWGVDFVHSFYTAMFRSGENASELYRAFQASGAAGSTIQEALSNYHLDRAKGVTGAMGTIERNTLGRIEDFAKALEETTKLLGFKRGLKEAGLTVEMLRNNPEGYRRKLEEIVTEVRNYAGSPDFSRQGSLVSNYGLNMLFMFFNARLQGFAADMGRLKGRDGAREAGLTALRAGATIGVPAVGLWYLNQRPENVEDYKARPEYERKNYFLIPRYDEKGPLYATNDKGEKVREYWRIPKRELGHILGNLTETALTFAQERDPAAVAAYGMDFLETASPVNISGKNPTERLTSVASSSNPVLKTPIEIGFNVDTFRNRPLLSPKQEMLSPINQYNPTTPQVYRDVAAMVPQYLAEPFGSPIKLKQIVDNFTGGAASQFDRRFVAEGRDSFTNAVAANPVGRRFVGTLRPDHSQEFSRIKEMKTESADKSFTLSEKAGEIIRMARKGDTTYLKELENDPRLVEAVAKKLDEEASPETDVDNAAKSLPVRDGTRGRWVTERLQALPPEKRDAELERLISVGVVTEEVLQSILAQDVSNN
ncbi:LPD38 domain-containing protein [Nibricoccus sp. IMCC34717]|uniref:LPD38 domain-containing protein n=1 Tax=Nibricoccus sp. IMCC34717 TaxID=3034021 RepID=UPI00384BF9DE